MDIRSSTSHEVLFMLWTERRSHIQYEHNPPWVCLLRRITRYFLCCGPSVEVTFNTNITYNWVCLLRSAEVTFNMNTTYHWVCLLRCADVHYELDL